ncbi:unnamed protein product [Protopolystoma xenopodis]|uniref:ATP-dependent rRNA helicase SPB4-like C-terminal extension domain-containing protein n=1 Tax=Protopolystoma xenopodis TaxID=117903 RepID=A0A448X1H3_9PLAT|nr:unnamed protein product [Protopolystoma xenopodis]
MRHSWHCSIMFNYKVNFLLTNINVVIVPLTQFIITFSIIAEHIDGFITYSRARNVLSPKLSEVFASDPSGQTTACSTIEEGASRLSQMLLNVVSNSTDLQSQAEKAYISFLRAYASFSGQMREWFCFKRLHLGHMAHAFCLNDTPSDVAARVTGKSKGVGKAKQVVNKSTNQVDMANSKSSKRKPPQLELDPDEIEHMKTKKSKTLVKPADMARRNMLAEYGL